MGLPHPHAALYIASCQKALETGNVYCEITKSPFGGIGGPACGTGGVYRTEVLVVCSIWHLVLPVFATRLLSISPPVPRDTHATFIT